MAEENFFIHLRSKIFVIPSDFHYLADIKQNIYFELITMKKYKIKSNVRETICQSFINYLVYGEIPDISLINIWEYDLLSQEFEFMENIIQLYKKHILNNTKSQLFFMNQELRKKYDEIKSNFLQAQRNYQQIILLLFNNDKISPNSLSILSFRMNLLKACLDENLEFVELLTNEIFIQNNLVFSLNKEEKTAGVLYSYLTNMPVIIPKSIVYEMQEYMVTIIHKKAFKKSSISKVIFEEDSAIEIIDDEAFMQTSIISIVIPSHVKRIGKKSFFCCLKLFFLSFSDDSELKIIDEEAFGSSKLNQFTLPQSVEVIKDCFCASDPKVTSLTIESKNKYFRNYKKHFFNGKTNPEKQNSKYDIIISYESYKESVKIWSFIKKIAPSAFFGNELLSDISFDENSKLDIIGNYSFGHCSFKNISIPSSVTTIEEGAFFECNNLESVTFSENSKLLTIEKKAFCETKIRYLEIPSSVVKLNSGWCDETPNLIKLKISPKSFNYSYLNDEIIIGKSESSGDVYDTIVFACRNIEKVVIPSFIKKIAGAAFCDCRKLKKIVFLENSELEIIEDNGFTNVSVERIFIPKHVKEINYMGFYSNQNLKKIEFDQNSELRLIGNQAFSDNSVERISIPSSVKKIDKYAFAFCQNLKIVDFSDDSELRYIGKNVFLYSPVQSLSIPSTVDQIEKKAFVNRSNLLIIEIKENSQLKTIRNDWFENSFDLIFMTPANFF